MFLILRPDTPAGICLPRPAGADPSPGISGGTDSSDRLDLRTAEAQGLVPILRKGDDLHREQRGLLPQSRQGTDRLGDMRCGEKLSAEHRSYAEQSARPENDHPRISQPSSSGS